MDSKGRILAYLSRHKSATGGELRAHLELSRQAMSLHLRPLIEGGKVVRSGTTRGARYGLASRAPAPAVVARAPFTEMPNNASEPREAQRCAIRFALGAGLVSFEVRDPGIGAFHSIAS